MRFNGAQNMKERWLSVAEIAAHLGVNPDTIYKWIERKQLPAHKVGRLWKFNASEVDVWVRAGKAQETTTMISSITPGSLRRDYVHRQEKDRLRNVGLSLGPGRHVRYAGTMSPLNFT